MGGYDLDLFVLSDIASCYQCCVCKDLPELGTLRIMCFNGHVVCSTCIDSRHPRPPSCYLCKTSVDYHALVAKQPAIERLIKELQMKCSKQEDGCAWTGPCSSLRDHEKKECEHRIEKCKYADAGCKFEARPLGIPAHQVDCKYRSISCPLAKPWDYLPCSKSHMAKDADSHRDLHCENHVCTYWQSGCRFSGKLKAVRDHEKIYCAVMHAKMAKLEKVINEDVMVDEQQKIDKAVKIQGSNYKKRIFSLKQEIKSLKSNINVFTAVAAEQAPYVTGQSGVLKNRKKISKGKKNHVVPVPDVFVSIVDGPEEAEDQEMDEVACSGNSSDDGEQARQDAHWNHADWAAIDREVAKATRQDSATVTAIAIVDTNGKYIETE